LGKERFIVPETLFSLSGPHPNLAEAVSSSIRNIDEDFRMEICENIILNSEYSLIKGLGERLLKELRKILPEEDTKVDVKQSKEANIASWIGASIVGSLSTFQSMWIDKSGYDEIGPPAVHRTCY
jgi:actin beta/gamma 1